MVEELEKKDPLERKTLMLGKIGGKRRRGQLGMRWLDSVTDSVEQTLGDGEGQRSLPCSPGDPKVRHDFAAEQHEQRE